MRSILDLTQMLVRSFNIHVSRAGILDIGGGRVAMLWLNYQEFLPRWSDVSAH